MNSRFPTRMLVLFTVAFFGFISEGLSQEKIPGKEDPVKEDQVQPLDDRPIPVKPKVQGIFAPPQVSVELKIRQSVVNGVRSITVYNGIERIEIADTNGKNIEFKRTRTVGGKVETTEYKAADFEALKSKSAEIAELYEKYTSRPNAPAPVGARIQFQVPQNGRLQGRQQMVFADEMGPSTASPRRIRVELEDRKIEIFDGADSSIRMRITKVLEGKEKVEEYTAENLREFKHLHPDMCLLYEKYTGLKSE